MERKGRPYVVYRDAYVESIDKRAEALVEIDKKYHNRIVIVPMDDCMIEIMYSAEHERLVGVVREIPCRD